MLPLPGASLDLSTPSPILRGRREYAAFLRGPVGAEVVRMGTVQQLREGAWPFFPINTFPEPATPGGADFGIQEAGGFTVESALPEAGKLVEVPDNWAVVLNGTSDFIYASNPGALNFGTGSFTVMMRARHDDLTFPRTTFAMSKQGAPWNGAAGWGVGAGYDASAQFVFLHDGANFVSGNIACDDGYRPGQLIGSWADLWLIVDRSDPSPANWVARIVINGVLQSGSLSLSSLTGSIDNADGFALGTAVGWFNAGAVDEFQAWSRALSVAEIQALHRKRLTGNEPGLRTYWRFDNTSGANWPDLSPAGNNALDPATLTARTAGAPLDAADQHRRIDPLLKDQACFIELVTTLEREDGSSVELTHQRTAKVRSVKRLRTGVLLEFLDLDMAALDAVYPSRMFAVADHPELFAEHVGRRVPQARGTVVKMPGTEVVKSGGLWRYAVLEQTAGVSCSLLAVYRDGRVVASSEYSLGTLTAGGYTSHTIDFSKEQIDPQGRRYEITADLLVGSASTLASDEVLRLLGVAGLTVDTTSFEAAREYGRANKMFCDAAYVSGRTLRVIIADLLLICRADLRQNAAGAWTLVQDRPREAIAMLDEFMDEIQLDEYGLPDLPKSFAIDYRPTQADEERFNTPALTRSTSGAAGERRYRNPYLRQHETADRLIDYLAKRAATARAAATVHAVQLLNGDVLNLKSATVWDGVKKFIAQGIVRQADLNTLELREYSDGVYTYTPGTLPADATNGYSPDYSQTPPAAPNVAPTVVSQGTDTDKDGKVSAFALIRVTKASLPAVNVAKVYAVVIDTTTNEQHISELLANPTDFELRFPALRVNRSHQVFSFCENAAGVKGSASATTSFTSANNTSSPAQVTGVGISQDSATSVRLLWTHTTLPERDKYIVFRQVNGGSFSEHARLDGNVFQDNNVSVGNTYGYKVRQVDRSGNESTDSGVASQSISRWIDDTNTILQGISGGSIANSSINQNRTYTGTSSATALVNAGGGTATFLADVFTYAGGVDKGNALADPVRVVVTNSKSGSLDANRVTVQNDDPTNNCNVTLDWRKVLA